MIHLENCLHIAYLSSNCHGLPILFILSSFSSTSTFIHILRLGTERPVYTHGLQNYLQTGSGLRDKIKGRCWMVFSPRSFCFSREMLSASRVVVGRQSGGCSRWHILIVNSVTPGLFIFMFLVFQESQIQTIL